MKEITYDKNLRNTCNFDLCINIWQTYLPVCFAIPIVGLYVNSYLFVDLYFFLQIEKQIKESTKLLGNSKLKNNEEKLKEQFKGWDQYWWMFEYIRINKTVPLINTYRNMNIHMQHVFKIYVILEWYCWTWLYSVVNLMLILWLLWQDKLVTW